MLTAFRLYRGRDVVAQWNDSECISLVAPAPVNRLRPVKVDARPLSARIMEEQTAYLREVAAVFSAAAVQTFGPIPANYKPIQQRPGNYTAPPMTAAVYPGPEASTPAPSKPRPAQRIASIGQLPPCRKPECCAPRIVADATRPSGYRLIDEPAPVPCEPTVERIPLESGKYIAAVVNVQREPRNVEPVKVEAPAPVYAALEAAPAPVEAPATVEPVKPVRKPRKVKPAPEPEALDEAAILASLNPAAVIAPAPVEEAPAPVKAAAEQPAEPKAKRSRKVKPAAPSLFD
jgi:hypothetical protein